MSLLNFEPLREDLEIPRGVSYEKIFIVRDPSTNIPVDISKYVAELTAMRLDTHEIVLRYLSSDLPTSKVVLTSDGEIKVTMSPTDTKEVEWDRGFYNLVILSPDRVQTKISRGFITLEESILGEPALDFPAVVAP